MYPPAATHNQGPTRPPGRGHRTRRGTAVVASVAFVVGLAGCGSSSSNSSSTTADKTPTTATSVTTTVSTDSSTGGAGDGGSSNSGGEPVANAVTVTSPGMSYEVSGPLQPGVGAITYVDASKESHMMAVARLKDGVTLDQLEKALDNGGEDAAGKLLAENPPPALGTPAPIGPDQHSTVTATDWKAGNYALICFFTNDQGVPHFKMGMVGMLQVKGSPATEKPKSDGTITIDDKTITVPEGFAGEGTFLVKNTGTKGHNISFAQLDSGTTLDSYFGAVGGAMGSNKSIDDAKGGTLAGGVDELDPGQSAYLTLDLPTGKHYAYVSTDEQDAGPGLPPQHGEFSN